MTSLAMIMGLLPMALALGEGAEQNAPLGRAVVGGLIFATVSTLFLVPVIYSLLRRRAPVDPAMKAEAPSAPHPLDTTAVTLAARS
jgi:Cu/Ag efflux pump CusA